MYHQSTTNDGNYQHHQMVIGDILLHSETKSAPIQVIIQSLTDVPSLIPDKTIILRALPKSSDIVNNQTKVPCDLKNPIKVKLTREHTFSSKKIMLIHETGSTLVKKLKSKVITIEPKIHTVDNVETRF
jgi:hypothetical protein